MRAVTQSLPDGVQPYRRTPDFTETSVPQGLLREHATRAGVWGVITVTDGSLRYVVPAMAIDEILDAEREGVITPEVLHSVEPIGTVTFYVTFFK